MNWLDAGEVRAWLASRPHRRRVLLEEKIGAQFFAQDACMDFVRALAAQADAPEFQGPGVTNPREVARLLVAAMDAKPSKGGEP